MLHEIFPSKIDNQYRDIEPDDKSRCIGFNENTILVCEGEKVRFPKYEDVKYEVSNARYLFSIDDIKYFFVDLNADMILGCEFISIQEFRRKKPKKEVFAGMTAYHLHIWYRDNKFCGKCSHQLKHGIKERVLKCEKCGNSVYPTIMPAVIVGIVDGDRILVTRYKDRPYRGYALIAGFIEIGETAEEAVVREALEETGLQVKDISYYKSQPWGIVQNLLLGYFCHLDGDNKINLDDEELEIAEWIHRDDLNVTNEDVALTNEMLCVFKAGKIK